MGVQGSGQRLVRRRERIQQPLVDRMTGFGTTIFAEMTALAHETGAINLGQGFPDQDGPAEVMDAAVAAIRATVADLPVTAEIIAFATAKGRGLQPSVHFMTRSGKNGASEDFS